jgi:hypothetical protein
MENISFGWHKVWSPLRRTASYIDWDNSVKDDLVLRYHIRK